MEPQRSSLTSALFWALCSLWHKLPVHPSHASRQQNESDCGSPRLPHRYSSSSCPEISGLSSVRTRDKERSDHRGSEEQRLLIKDSEVMTCFRGVFCPGVSSRNIHLNLNQNLKYVVKKRAFSLLRATKVLTLDIICRYVWFTASSLVTPNEQILPISISKLTLWVLAWLLKGIR